MSNTFASRAADTFLPPALSSTTGYASLVTGNNVTQISVTNSAGETALPFGAKKQGYLTIQNLSSSLAPAFVALKLDAGTASITTTTGWEIPVGQERSWFVDKDICDSIEHITASSTATLKMYVSSLVE